ncbi:hypothetical protein [Plantactinospora veratri]
MERLGHWRLVGTPRPGRAERLGRLVGLRVLRIPGLRRVVVVAGSTDRLRDLLARPASLHPTRRAVVVVAYWRAPRRGWSSGIGPLEHLRRHRVALPGRGRGTAVVTVRLSRPAQLREVLRAALSALAPERPLPAPAGPDVTSHATLPAYLPAGGTVLLGEPVDNPDIRSHDVLLRAPGSGGEAAGGLPYAVGWPASRHGLQPPGAAPAVLVDARRINPRGRRPDCYQPGAPGYASTSPRRPAGPPGRTRWTAPGSPPRCSPPCARPAWSTARRSPTPSRWRWRRCWSRSR